MVVRMAAVLVMIMRVVLWWAAVGRQPEEVEARGGEWIWGSGDSEGGGGGVELVMRMAAGVWGNDDGDGHEGGVMVAAMGRQPEEVEARGGEWIWGS
ncbi:hypothetical protein Tco_1081277, partial [Tanacetum coccineum]